MTVSPRASAESGKKAKEGEHARTLVAGMDVPFVSPRPGRCVKIPKTPTPGIGSPLRASTPKIDDGYDPDCKCKSPKCHDPCKRGPTVTTKTPEKNSIAGMQSFALTGKETTREYRIHEVLTSDWETSSMGDLAESDEDFAAEQDSRPGVNLLVVLISTVMLLAADKGVPDEVLNAVESYLRCIKDDEDNTPPNVQGLLNYISLLKGGEDKGDADKGDADEDQGIVEEDEVTLTASKIDADAE